MTSSDLLLHALGPDLSSMTRFMGFEPTPAQGVFAILAYAAANVLVAALLYLLLPKHYRQSRLSGMSFLFTVLFFIPVLGVFGLLMALTTMRRRNLNPNAERFTEVPVPSFQLQTAAGYAPKASSRPLAQLNDTGAPAEPRIQALLALQAMPFRLVSPILRGVLDDPVEDIRLLAYGLLDNREKRINEAIHRERAALTGADSALAIALRRKRLAQLYWELIHQDLAQNDLRRHARTQAASYATEALEHLPDDAGLWVLLGKLLSDGEDIEAAGASFERALELGYPEIRLLPYLAETAYRRRDWPCVRELLHRLGGMQTQPRIVSVIAFWTGARSSASQTPPTLVPARRPSAAIAPGMYARRRVGSGKSPCDRRERDE